MISQASYARRTAHRYRDPGRHRGDVITGCGDTDVETVKDLTRVVARTDPGTKARVTIWRSGEVRNLTVRTGRYPT